MSSLPPLTIGFLAWRKGFLKVLGSLIQGAVNRRHRVILFWNPDEAKPGETVSEGDLRTWPEAVRVLYRPGSPLFPLLRSHGVHALGGPSLHYLLRATGLEGEAAMRGSGIRLYSVDYLLETISSNPEGYLVVDTTFYASEHWRQLHWQLYEKEGFDRVRRSVDLGERSAVCGAAMLDQFALVNKAAARKKYGIPSDRPVVLLMSLKMTEVTDPWRQLVWGEGWKRWGRVRELCRYPSLVGGVCAGMAGRVFKGNGYRALLESLQRFCRRNDALLVVKSRMKNQDPGFVRELADIFVEKDEDVFPYNSIELMAVSDLCVHFQSGAVLEAAFAGVPSLSVKISQSHYERERYFKAVFGGDPGGLQNFDGVVWSADPGEAVTLLDRSRLADFRLDYETRRQYVEKFLGFDDTRSSERVLDVIERQLG